MDIAGTDGAHRVVAQAQHEAAGVVDRLEHAMQRLTAKAHGNLFTGAGGATQPTFPDVGKPGTVVPYAVQRHPRVGERAKDVGGADIGLQRRDAGRPIRQVVRRLDHVDTNSDNDGEPPIRNRLGLEQDAGKLATVEQSVVGPLETQAVVLRLVDPR